MYCGRYGSMRVTWLGSPSRKSAYALPVNRVLNVYVPRIGLPELFGWKRLSNQLTSSTPNFIACRPWIQLRLSANCA